MAMTNELEKKLAELTARVEALEKTNAPNIGSVTTIVKPTKAKGNTVSVKTTEGKVFQITFSDGVVQNNQFRKPSKPNEVITLDALMADESELTTLLNYAIANPSSKLYTIAELTKTQGG